MSSVARTGDLKRLRDDGRPPRLLTTESAALVARLRCGPGRAAPTGQALYLRHCASCHGAAGKGDGPVTGSLQGRPPDLTRIAKRAAGRFDETRVMRIIDGRRAVAAHGPREMPVWGAVFSAEAADYSLPGYVSLLHTRTLSDYLQSIQEE